MREIVAGIGLMIGGTAYAVTAYTSLPLGTLRQMGPGMFPLGLGALLCFIGLGILVLGIVQRHDLPRFSLRPIATVLGAIGAFAVVVTSFGLFPAIAACTALASLAAPGNVIMRTTVISLGLMLVAWLIFIVALSVPVEIVKWGL